MTVSKDPNYKVHVVTHVAPVQAPKSIGKIRTLLLKSWILII